MLLYLDDIVVVLQEDDLAAVTPYLKAALACAGLAIERVKSFCMLTRRFAVDDSVAIREIGVQQVWGQVEVLGSSLHGDLGLAPRCSGSQCLPPATIRRTDRAIALCDDLVKMSAEVELLTAPAVWGLPRMCVPTQHCRPRSLSGALPFLALSSKQALNKMLDECRR